MKNTTSAVCLLGTVMALIAGCASKERGSEQFRPGSGIAEYRHITDTATQAIRTALASLDRVVAQSNRCSSEAMAALNTEVQRLQVDSIQVRARSQAILARGDAYFERWHETLARVKDPEVRNLAEKRRPLLQESFRDVKGSSKQVQGAFKPFLAGLRGVRNALESDPESLRTAASQELAATTRAHGQQLLQHLSDIRKELDSMSDLLKPSRS